MHCSRETLRSYRYHLARGKDGNFCVGSFILEVCAFVDSSVVQKTLNVAQLG